MVENFKPDYDGRRFCEKFLDPGSIPGISTKSFGVFVSKMASATLRVSAG